MGFYMGIPSVEASPDLPSTIVLGGCYKPTYSIGYNLTYNQDVITFQLSYLS